MDVPYGSATAPFGSGPYLRTDPKRQYLHIFEFGSAAAPAPVFFFAHGNGADADALNQQELADIASVGYSAISWESVSTISDADDVFTCWADQLLVYEWAKTNAATYNLDMNNVIIGGRSRGSICGWSLGQSGDTEIKAIYMYNALPDPVWQDVDTWDPVADVSAQSPPTYLAYGPECPKPITQDCTISGDIHNPRHGQKIVDRYEELGLTITLTDGMHNLQPGNTPNVMRYFPSLVDPSITLSPTTPTTMQSADATCAAKLAEVCFEFGYTKPKQCKECATENKAALNVAGCTIESAKIICMDNSAAASTLAPVMLALVLMLP
jgi:predicted esterase